MRRTRPQPKSANERPDGDSAVGLRSTATVAGREPRQGIVKQKGRFDVPGLSAPARRIVHCLTLYCRVRHAGDGLA